jgi:hypothetical protein
MSEKRKSTSPSATQVKNRQKSNSTEEKLDVISRLQKGERIVDIWRNVRLAHSNICTIGDNADRITESAKCLENINVNDLNQ